MGRVSWLLRKLIVVVDVVVMKFENMINNFGNFHNLIKSCIFNENDLFLPTLVDMDGR